MGALINITTDAEISESRKLPQKMRKFLISISAAMPIEVTTIENKESAKIVHQDTLHLPIINCLEGNFIGISCSTSMPLTRSFSYLQGGGALNFSVTV